MLGTTRATFMAGPPLALDMAPSKATAGAMLEHLMLEPFASLHKYAGPAVGEGRLVGGWLISLVGFIGLLVVGCG